MDKNYEQRRVAQLRDFSYQEIYDTVPLQVALEIDMHQVADMRDHQTPTELWPRRLEVEHPETIDTLTNNTSLYDDEVEQFIDQDSLLNQFMYQRMKEPGDIQLAAAIRARRTIMTRIFLSELETMGVTSSQAS